MEIETRIGQGMDIHRLVPGRELWLGGVKLSFTRGLAGYSDGDVLAHAATDAILGAAGLGDMGRHFPSNDPRWKDASSIAMLTRAAGFVAGGGWQVDSLHVVLLLESPRIASHTARMEHNLAGAIGAPVAAVNISSTTADGLGLVGTGEGAMASAVCLISREKR